MSTVFLKGEPVQVKGEFPQRGEKAKSFMLVDKDLKDVSLATFSGKYKVLNIVPSLDTEVCITSARQFNEAIGHLDDTVLLLISADLPFAQARACAAAGLQHVVTLSSMRGRDFYKDYGVMITDVPLAGLMARAVVILDKNDIVLYSELVPEISQEPNYTEALKALSKVHPAK